MSNEAGASPSRRTACIRGVGSYLPPDAVDNDTLAARLGIPPDTAAMHARSGVRSRRFAAEGLGAGDLGAEAARRALAAASLGAHELDLLVVASRTTEHAFPGASVFTQRLLEGAVTSGPDGGMPRFVPALDVRDQCAGFLFALALAQAQVLSGLARNVLVVGAEVHSATLDLTPRGAPLAERLGDGAGAFVVSAGPGEGRAIGPVRLGSDGRDAEAAMHAVYDARRRPFFEFEGGNRSLHARVSPERLWPRFDAARLTARAIETLPGELEACCAAADTTPRALDLVLLQAPTPEAHAGVVRALGLDPARVRTHRDEVGELSAAGVPHLLDRALADGALRPGMRVALAAFGSGLAWGTALLDW